MVEQVDVGDPHWVLVNMCRVLSGAALEVGLPLQPVDIGGAAQAFEDVVADARGMKLSGLMLIQKASDSIRPPLRPSMRTRPRRRVEVAEHQVRNRSVSGNSIGLITSIIVRRTTHGGWMASNPHSRSWSWPMSWVWRAVASSRSRP